VSTTLRRALEAAIGTAVLVLAVAWLSGGCGEKIGPGTAGHGSGERANTGGREALVERRTEASVEWASGAVESARRTAVAARILARIEEVRVVAGSEVREGDLLVRLDARDLSARAREADEALRAARAELALARSERERTATLVREGVSTGQRLDQAESTLRVAEAQVDRLEETQREAGTVLSHAEIRAQSSGRVIDRLAEPGDTAVPGRPLLRIYDPAALRVEVPVRESLAVRLRVGEALAVRVPSLDAAFDGVIDEIVPFAEPGARTMLVKVRLAHDARLYAGMFARAAIPAGEVSRLLVPEAAIERIGQLAFATVVSGAGDRARRLVTTGLRAGPGTVEVLSGLAEGERVLLPESATPPSGAPEPAPENASADAPWLGYPGRHGSL